MPPSEQDLSHRIKQLFRQPLDELTQQLPEPRSQKVRERVTQNRRTKGGGAGPYPFSFIADDGSGYLYGSGRRSAVPLPDISSIGTNSYGLAGFHVVGSAGGFTAAFLGRDQAIYLKGAAQGFPGPLPSAAYWNYLGFGCYTLEGGYPLFPVIRPTESNQGPIGYSAALTLMNTYRGVPEGSDSQNIDGAVEIDATRLPTILQDLSGSSTYEHTKAWTKGPDTLEHAESLAYSATANGRQLFAVQSDSAVDIVEHSGIQSLSRERQVHLSRSIESGEGGATTTTTHDLTVSDITQDSETCQVQLSPNLTKGSSRSYSRDLQQTANSKTVRENYGSRNSYNTGSDQQIDISTAIQQNPLALHLYQDEGVEACIYRMDSAGEQSSRKESLYGDSGLLTQSTLTEEFAVGTGEYFIWLNGSDSPLSSLQSLRGEIVSNPPVTAQLGNILTIDAGYYTVRLMALAARTLQNPGANISNTYQTLDSWKDPTGEEIFFRLEDEDSRSALEYVGTVSSYESEASTNGDLLAITGISMLVRASYVTPFAGDGSYFLVNNGSFLNYYHDMFSTWIMFPVPRGDRIGVFYRTVATEGRNGAIEVWDIIKSSVVSIRRRRGLFYYPWKLPKDGDIKSLKFYPQQGTVR